MSVSFSKTLLQLSCMMTLMPIMASASSSTTPSSSSYQPPPAPISSKRHAVDKAVPVSSPRPQPLADENGVGHGDAENIGIINEDDYGYWNPEPYYGGDVGTAPIPHGRTS